MRRSTRVAAVRVKVESTVAARAVHGADSSVHSVRVAAAGKRSLSVRAAASPADETASIPRQATKKIKVEFDTVHNIGDANSVKKEMAIKQDAHRASATTVGDSDDSLWRDLCPIGELSCVVTLTSGQVFTWKRYADTDAWIGVVGQHVYKLREREQQVQYQLLHPPQLDGDLAHAVLHDYFRLEIEAAPLYKLWSEKDDDMSRVIRSLPGLRIIRQDPVECLFAFICSSNNNIQRITQMITKLKATYGELLFKDSVTSDEFYAFPSVETMATLAEEQKLREIGFGYRAPFVIKSGLLLKQLGGREYLLTLRGPPSSGNDDEYAEKLMAFTGVGRKVADCIGLFSLDKLYAIPVDTHVWQIACREFDPTLKNKKSLTPTIYQAVGDHFRARFSPLAGWAHSVLFTGDLSSFQSHLPEDMQNAKKAHKTKSNTIAADQKSTSSKGATLQSTKVTKTKKTKSK